MSSKSGATHNRSQPSSSPPYNNDTEAASQQLLAESSPLRHQRAAIRASQLNLARVDALPKPSVMAPSTHAGNAAKSGKLGKLKRISFPGEPQRRARGAKVYDIEPSPQKRSSLPVQVAVFEVEEQGEVSADDEAEDMVPETSQAEPETDKNTEREDLPTHDNSTAGKRIEEEVPASPVASLKADVLPAARESPNHPLKRKNLYSATSAYPSDTGTAEAQDADGHLLTTSTTQKTNAPVVKKRRLLKGPKFVDPEAEAPVDDLGVPIGITQYETRPRGDPQPEVQIPIRSNRRRIPQAEAEDATDAPANAVVATASGPREEPSQPSRVAQSPMSVSKPSKRKATERKVKAEKKTVEPEEADEDGVEKDAQAIAAQPRSSLEVNGERSEDDGENTIAEDDKKPGNEDQQFDAEDADQAALPANNVQFDRLPALEKVFQYTDSEARPGVCLTNLGRKIHRTCDRSRVALSQSGKGPSLENAAKCRDDIVNLLRSINIRVKEERRVFFKTDAFAHLFRALALVFEAMHDKLQEKEGDVTRSLDAMQILHPYVCETIRFKGAIDAWKVKVPQREPGDKLIKDVESHLIVFLRAVEQEFQSNLQQLKSAEQRRQAQLDLQRKREEEEHELLRKEEVLSAKKKRRKRWQDLHIVRMQCEPDPARRRRLRFFEPVEVVEIDANGDQFERVPFFGERSMPPPQWTAASSGREWTEQQETVLLDALQSTAALEKIFRTHCRPGGALRAFSVSDFAVKMIWVRSGWSRLSQQHGWEIPEWVKNIPVLP